MLLNRDEQVKHYLHLYSHWAGPNPEAGGIYPESELVCLEMGGAFTCILF